MIPIYRVPNYLPKIFDIIKYRKLSVADLEKNFAKVFGYKKIIFFSKGRYALYSVLKSLKKGEVLVPSFICTTVLDAITAANHKIVPINFKNSVCFDYSLGEIRGKITDDTRAIIVYHPQGYPTNIEEIVKETKKYNILIIEDCANSLGARINNKYVGTFGDIALFSFGFPSKNINALGGGGIAVNSDLNIILKKNRNNFPYKNVMVYLSALIATCPAFYGIFRQLTKSYIKQNQSNFSFQKNQLDMSKLSLEILNYCLEFYFDQIVIQRTRAKSFDNIINRKEYFKTLEIRNDFEPIYLKYHFFVNGDKKKAFINYMNKNGIDIKTYLYQKEDWSIETNNLFKNLVAIPNYSWMTETEYIYIKNKLESFQV